MFDNENEYVNRMVESRTPYICKRCGHGSYSDHYCKFCDYPLWRYLKNRGYIYFYPIIPTFMIVGIWFYPFLILGWVFLAILLALQFTEEKRMRKHFQKR